MSLPFEGLREQLLRAGIAPRHAGRYVTELREHLSDLVEHERASGLSEEQAIDHARQLLGSDTLLAQAMIDRGAPRSLAARAPCVVFAMLPAALWIAVIWTDVVLMIHLLWPVRGLGPAELPQGYREVIAVVGFVVNYLVGVLLAAGCITIALRQRLASGWVWVGLSLIAVTNWIMGFHTHVIPAEGIHPAGMVYSAVAIVYLQGHASLAATLGAWALHALVLFALAAVVYRLLQTRFMPLQG